MPHPKAAPKTAALKSWSTPTKLPYALPSSSNSNNKPAYALRPSETFSDGLNVFLYSAMQEKWHNGLVGLKIQQAHRPSETLGLATQPTCYSAYFCVTFSCMPLGSVHISSVRKILSAKARLQGEKHSKVEHLASIFNAAGAFLSQNIAAWWNVNRPYRNGN